MAALPATGPKSTHVPAFPPTQGTGSRNGDITNADRRQLCITELPEGYRVVGIECGSFVITNANGHVLLIEQDGHQTGVTTRRAINPTHDIGRLGADAAVLPYTSPMD